VRHSHSVLVLSRVTEAVYSQTFLTHLDSVAAACHYSDYVEKYVTYPPHGPLPLPGKSTEFDPGCDVWDEIFNATLLVNPAFNIYHIFDMVRSLITLMVAVHD